MNFFNYVNLMTEMNTPVSFFGDNTRIGAVCADSGGDEAGVLRVCDGDV